jgi:hypothetical protein
LGSFGKKFAGKKENDGQGRNDYVENKYFVGGPSMTIELADIHCHILPGIDDGPAGMGETVDMARVLFSPGVFPCDCHPHVQNIFHNGRIFMP